MHGRARRPDRAPLAPAPFWQTTPEGWFARLGSSATGLSSAAARERLARDGPNSFAAQSRRHIGADLARRLANPLVAILLVAAAASGLTGDPASFAIITCVILLSTVLDMVQQHRAEATAEALRRSIALTARALRDGNPCDLPVGAVVSGDVVTVAAGDLVPADGVLLAANHLDANEAVLTGEPFPVRKTTIVASHAEEPAEAINALFAGTAIVAGTGTLLVVATGARTRFGAIAAALDRTPAPTAFERDMRRFGTLIVRMTGFLAAFVLLANLALGRAPLESFLFSTALAVGLTPELLPMIMTVALAHGARRMARERVVVKRLSAIHDLGRMDVLCTDKTGTLTQARITLTGHHACDGSTSDAVLELAGVNAAFETGLKSPLDAAILARIGPAAAQGWTKLDERPFDFERRRVSVLAQKAGKRLEIVKGAPEHILSAATQTGLPGAERPLDARQRAALAQAMDRAAADGLRVLGIAWKRAPGASRIDRTLEADLVFAGYCTFADPPRPDAPHAVARLAAAGVAIKIVSGDAAPVMRHLVDALGLPLRGMVTGDRLSALSDAALAALVERTDLFARVTPDQKTRIVKALMARGHTVGFVGDGINDAPAIRQADIGLSVEGATDVAREAADMILLSPDLDVLGDGVAQGRRTHANIVKYIRMGTSSNFGNMVTMAIASLFLPFLPLTATQVLLNNLIYDFSQTGIPFDRVDPGELDRPRAWDMRALLRFTAIMGLLSSLFDLATFALLLAVLHEGVAAFRAGWFVESMASQILVVFVIRSALPLWRARPHRALLVSAGGGLAAALAVTLGPWRATFGFGPLGPIVLAAIAALVIVYLVAADRAKHAAMRG